MADAGPRKGLYVSVIELKQDSHHGPDPNPTGSPLRLVPGEGANTQGQDFETQATEKGRHDFELLPAYDQMSNHLQYNRPNDTGPRNTSGFRKTNSPEASLRACKRWRSAIAKVIDENKAKRKMGLQNVVVMLMEFLEASRTGDYETVGELLVKYPDIDFNNTTDNLGKSPLILAVQNDDANIVSALVNVVKQEDWREAVMTSISQDHDEITRILLETVHYDEYSKKSYKKHHEHQSRYPQDLTPLMLAATRNQYPIVKLLVSRGESIDRPHHAYCQCAKCKDTLARSDELEVAKIRLLTYRGLASNSYISLTSDDPLLEAFNLRLILRKNAQIEKYFKAEYKKLASQLSEYAVKLLKQVRSGNELDIMLSESTARCSKDGLARLKLAVRYGEKLFVTHPSCQKKIQYMWSDGWGAIQKKSIILQLLWCLVFGVCYPFLAVIYWIYPWGPVGRFLETPVVKFISEAFYYLVFVCILITYTFTEEASEGYRISEHGDMGAGFLLYNATASDPAIGDVYLRNYHFRNTTILISIHILGYLWQMVKTLYRDRMYYFTDNSYNLMDLVSFPLLAASMCLRLYTTIQVRLAVDHFSNMESWVNLLTSNGTDGESHLYWLDADRGHWRGHDSQFIAEAVHSYAVLPALMRVTYILGVSESVGPLLISLKYMFVNFVIFMSVFLIVLVAFLVSFHNLYWYYDYDTRVQAETPVHPKTEAEINYGNLVPLIRTMQFTLFGMTDHTTLAMSDDYNADVTLTTGYVLFGAYNWLSGIIFLNMLIGMMAKAYDQISNEKDMEWKFDRTKLYLDYMKEGNTLCVPFNMMPTWWSARNLCCQMSGCCGRDSDDRIYTENKEEEEEQQQQQQQLKEEKKKMKKIPKAGYTHDAYGEDTVNLSLNGYDVHSNHVHTPVKHRHHHHRRKKPATKYAVVMKQIIDRFITAATTPGDDEEENSLELITQMKSEMTQFRHDLARISTRNDRDKKRVFAHLNSLEEKLGAARLVINDISVYCSDTRTVLHQDIKPEIRENLSRLSEVNTNVKGLKEDVYKKDEEVRGTLKTITETQESKQFAPIKSVLGTIEEGLKQIKKAPPKERAAKPKSRPKPKPKPPAEADYDDDWEWEPFPVDGSFTRL